VCSSDLYSFGNVDAGTFTLTVSKSGYQSATQQVAVTAGETTVANIAIQPETQEGNLALGRPFYATAYWTSTYHPNKAGDGNTATFWWSDKYGDEEATERLWVDLGSNYRVATVEIAWYGNLWAREYKIHVSTDGRRWSEVYRTYKGTSGTSTITFGARDARYVRVECCETGTDDDIGYGIAEFRVFESGSN